MKRIFTLISLLVFVLAVAPARADTLEKNDGSIMRGRVITESSNDVTFEVSTGGITLRQRIPRSQVRVVRREVLEGPGFCAIPLIGEIGVDIKADDFRDALTAARRGGAKYVILVVDSPGGSIAERNKILAVMVQTKDLKLVAYVRRALSAAAVLAVACPQICMAPDASIGAAVAFKVGPDGIPQDVEEKFRSAIRAGERAAAALGDRSDLWIRGMSELNLELSVVNEGGRPRLVEGLSAPDATPVKRKGEILTLTAKEAFASGLSTATTGDISDIREALGIKAWHNTGDQAWSVIANRAFAEKSRAEEAARRQYALRVRNEYLLKVQPEISAISDRLEKAFAQASAAGTALEQLRVKYDEETQVIAAVYQQAVAQASSKQDPQAWRDYCIQNANNRVANLRLRFGPELTRFEAIRDEAAAEMRMLMSRRNGLLASIPPEE